MEAPYAERSVLDGCSFNNWRSLGCAGPCGRAFELISIG